MDSTIVVVGAGPSAIAAIWKLLSLKQRPIVIDIGLTAEDGTSWDRPGVPGKSGTVLKTLAGSDFMYRYPASTDVEYNFDGSVPISAALGGLSLVWGTNIQGVDDLWGDDASRRAEMRTSFGEVLRLMPHTGAKDGLDKVFSWPVDFAEETPISSRMRKVLTRVSAGKFIFGMSRNATRGTATGCIMCGKCLSGCPENLTFSGNAVIDGLIRSNAIDYRRGKVHKLVESTCGVEIHVESLNGDAQDEIIFADLVFLGAGAIASSLILMRSGLVDTRLTLDDSQVFYLPVFAWRDQADNSGTYALSQVCVESSEGLVDSKSFHLQLYETSESFPQRASTAFPRLSRLIPRQIFQRLMGGIGFISSDDSGKISIEDTGEVLKVELVENGKSKSRVYSVAVNLMGSFMRRGLLPLAPFVTVPNVGASYHVGALKNEDGLALDEMGRPHELSKIHVVDSASLPRIPAGPITLVSMANANRIVQNVVVP